MKPDSLLCSSLAIVYPDKNIVRDPFCFDARPCDDSNLDVPFLPLFTFLLAQPIAVEKDRFSHSDNCAVNTTHHFHILYAKKLDKCKSWTIKNRFLNYEV